MSIDELRSRRHEILSLAARHGASNVLFGSVLHGDDRPDSAIELLVEVAREVTPPWIRTSERNRDSYATAQAHQRSVNRRRPSSRVVLTETEKNSPQILNCSMRNTLTSVRKFLNEKKGRFEFLGEAARIFRSVLQPPFGSDADLLGSPRRDSELKLQRRRWPFSSSRRAWPSS